MAPTPITLIENNMSSSLSRYGWETLDQMDPKAIGGHLHLPLNKRYSTPVGVGNPTKLTAPHNQNGLSSGGEYHSGNVNNLHRHLDRSHSEPLGKHQVQPAVTSSSRYKTELCRPYAETGFCKYGEKCQFAHGGSELRNMPRHPKYKTELCRTFHTTGLCGYGTRCHFIHNAEERRNFLNFGNYEETSLTPPGSLHGSPTSSAGTFFGEQFSMMTNMGPADDAKFNFLSLETPPVSPVESLAGDIENLSLSSPALSDSPSPPLAPSQQCAFMEDRYFRLPIFETLKEF